MKDFVLGKVGTESLHVMSPRVGFRSVEVRYFSIKYIQQNAQISQYKILFWKPLCP